MNSLALAFSPSRFLRYALLLCSRCRSGSAYGINYLLDSFSPFPFPLRHHHVATNSTPAAIEIRRLERMASFAVHPGKIARGGALFKPPVLVGPPGPALFARQTFPASFVAAVVDIAQNKSVTLGAVSFTAVDDDRVLGL